MNIHEADGIVANFGNYIAGNFNLLFSIFGGHIPESLSPYPIDKVEQAGNTLGQHYFDTKNDKGRERIEKLWHLLAWFTDDESAIQFNIEYNQKYPELRIKSFRKFTKQWLESQ